MAQVVLKNRHHCTVARQVSFTLLRSHFLFFLVIFGGVRWFFFDVREEMSAPSATVLRLSATAPQQHHSLDHLATLFLSGSSCLGCSCCSKCSSCASCSISFWLSLYVPGCFLLKNIFDPRKSVEEVFNLLVICATLFHVV